MANFLRLLLGGLIALGAILVTLLVGVLVVIGTAFGLIASRFRSGGASRPSRAGAGVNRSPNARPRSPAGGTGTGDIIDVEVTDVTETTPVGRAQSPSQLRG